MEKTKEELVQIWLDKIEEIKETGNCTNVIGEKKMFRSGKNHTWTPEQMIDYCNKMIDKIEDN